jgi:D-amino peptidase
LKLFISSDIEGTCGITHWDETDYNRGGRWYDYFRAQMTREVAAACRGAREGGAESIHVRDAHDSARNIIPMELPTGVTICRGWARSPLCMAEGLNGDFDALALTGYHSPAHGDGSPLSHTMNTSLDEIKINGKRASEFTIVSYTAALFSIPVIFLSGDEAICEQAASFIPGITTAAVSRGLANSSTSLHPEDALQMIRERTREAVKKHFETNGKNCLIPLPEHFNISVKYAAHPRAYTKSFYPGARRLDEKTIAFETDDYMEALRFFHFVL